MVRVGHTAYTDQVHELAKLVPHLVTPALIRIDRYIYGLVPEIHGIVRETEPTTIQSAIFKAKGLPDDAVLAISGNNFKRVNNGNQAWGRAFALGANEALQDPNIVTGMFSLNDQYAIVLFDSGADYSFVSTKFMPLNNAQPSDLNFSYDKVENLNPQSTPQVLLSFEEYTPPVTHPEEVKETIGILMEVEPLHEPQLEDLGLTTCNHVIPLSSREVSSFDELKPQPQPLLNYLPLCVNLGDKRGIDPPIKLHSPDSFRIKVIDKSTINTPPSPHVASFHPKDIYCYYHPCVDDPKKHYGFKPGLLGQGGSLGIDLFLGGDRE
ncbi:ribonuclease H-like domain-containing protein [Tanacetum coccineum]